MSTTTLQYQVNSHWAAFVADPKDTADPSEPRRPRPTHSHRAALVEGADEDEDLDEEEDAGCRRRRRLQKVNSHWAALVEGGDEEEEEDMDEEESAACRRRRPRQTINSHWASGVVEEEDDESEGDNDPFADQWKSLLDETGKSTKKSSAGAVDKSSKNNKKAPTGANEKETGGKTKRYSRNKPRLPTTFELKYRKSPTNMAVIVLPSCAQHTLVRPTRPGLVKTVRKSGLVQATRLEEL
ncbi:hypothetical protein QBC37DRAFT_379679 [Rhypophila decipiens]|uniref:Uncharacterized protein n=1 Tax=Rhypophila decipiens TaxID=261697 RepID=A0AAN6XWA9_9PEZI|nr:hypothetical protein QBC37DRAFT_379679 [Rhypophila decipiens]